MPETDALTRDHIELEDTRVTRRYFAKFRAITGHLARVKNGRGARWVR